MFNVVQKTIRFFDSLSKLCNEYTTAPKTKTKKKIKAGINRPKKPLSAYLLYCKHRKDELRAYFDLIRRAHDVSEPELLKIIGPEWTLMNPQDRLVTIPSIRLAMD